MKILVLASDNPSPPINGTRIRNFHLWNEVRKAGHEVKLLCITRDPKDLELNNNEIEFFLFTRKNILNRIWNRLMRSYHEWPVSDSLENRVKVLVEMWNPDYIHAEELRMGHYLPSLTNGPINSLCAHNVESELLKKTLAAPFPFAVMLFNSIYRFNLKRFEKKMIRKTHIRFTYSEVDRKIYENLYPGHPWSTSSNGVNEISLSQQEQELPPPQKLLFLGSLGYAPNIEGLFWFLDEVYPKVKSKIELTVAGSFAPAKVIEKLSQMGVNYVGSPTDLRSVYVPNSMLLVPLLSGSGTRGKILEALMYNRAVLTTTIGVEGLELPGNNGVLIADGAQEYAQAILDWLEMNPALRKNLADRGREAVMSRYTWRKVAKDITNSWQQLLNK
ncbi:MAG TPA: glycosyltransferase family 4 protein [Bacteriovoracaceae bacterium]|nr:glycosyltransferase family 4 protein [Bacteriovoracaceae bacterium]